MEYGDLVMHRQARWLSHGKSALTVAELPPRQQRGTQARVERPTLDHTAVLHSPEHSSWKK